MDKIRQLNLFKVVYINSSFKFKNIIRRGLFTSRVQTRRRDREREGQSEAQKGKRVRKREIDESSESFRLLNFEIISERFDTTTLT